AFYYSAGYVPVLATSTQWVAARIGLVIATGVYGFLLYRLLLQSTRSGKVVFVVLLLLALFSVVSAGHAFVARTPTGGRFSPWPRVMSAFITIGMASLAYFYFRGQQQQPNGLTRRC